MTTAERQRLISDAVRTIAQASAGCTANKREVTRIRKNVFRRIDELQDAIWREHRRRSDCGDSAYD